MIYEWPTPLLAPRVTNLRIMNNTRSAGESITGFEQVAASMSDRWALTLEFNNLKREAILPFRALKAALQGRANAVRVPIRDAWLWPSDDAIGIVNSIGRYDPWPDHDAGDDVADIATTISGTMGDKSADVSFSMISKPTKVVLPGMYFGAGADLHIIRLDGVEWASSTATLSFEPALRRDHVAADFKFRPSLVCRLASDEVGQHPLEHGRRTSPMLELVEVLPDELSAMEGGE